MSSILRRAGTKLGRWLARAADPASAVGEVQVYAKTVNGVTQLFAMDDAGVAYQLTPPAVINDLWGPRVNPHPADDEFDTNALAAKWSQTGYSGNLNFGTRPAPYAAPGVNAASWENLRGPDNTTDPSQNSWLRCQPGLGFAGAFQSLTSPEFGGAVPADVFVWARFRYGYRNGFGISPGDYDCGITFFEDTGAGINYATHVTMSLSNTSEGTAGLKPVLSCNPGSGETVVSEGGLQNDVANQLVSMHTGVIGVQKTGNDYHAWLINDSGRAYFDATSSVGYAGINAVGFYFNTVSGGAANGGIPIFDIDWMRFYEGIWVP